MFSWLNKQGVRSDRGFEVQFVGRFEAEYREEGRVMTIEVESGLSGGLPSILIDPNAFERWDDAAQGEFNSLNEQERLLTNFREAIEFQGLLLVVQAAGPNGS